jgi:hypothetical protein
MYGGRSVDEHGMVQVAKVGAVTIGRARFEPG